MSTTLIRMQDHMTLPLSVRVYKDQLVMGQFCVDVYVDKSLVSTENLAGSTEHGARANADFAMELWARRLMPVFDAGYAAGIDEVVGCAAHR